MQPFTSPQDLPLKGHTLIEASAGTGKTFTITNLYLRLIMEEGLAPEEILVVTFTKAATEELRAKIRERLTNAISYLEKGKKCDDALSGIISHALATVSGGEREVSRRLRVALLGMDLAAVYTIHGFCQRVLNEFPLETGVATKIQDIIYDDELYLPAIMEFVRSRLLKSSPLISDAVLDLFGAEHLPQKILSAITPLLRQPTPKIACKVTFNAIEKELSSLNELFSKDLTPQSFTDKIKELEKLLKTNPQIATYAHTKERLISAVCSEASEFVKKYLEEKKQKRQALSFDDMLLKLRDSLIGTDKGNRLAKMLQRRFKVALIDEFQDTDSIQWEIFKAIYKDPQTSRLFLIGDPKQAIYGFRGADIFTYLKAKKYVPQKNQYNLETNWRSSPGLVDVINGIFSAGSHNAFMLEGIEFFEVKAKKEKECLLLLDKQRLSPWDKPVEFWMSFYQSEKNDIQMPKCPSCAKLVAAKVAEIISLGAEGRLELECEAGGTKKITAGDIAILVRSHNQAREVMEALWELGVQAVYQGPTSVFNSYEALELLYILSAILNPSDVTSVRTALGTAILGHNAEDLASMEDEELSKTIEAFVRLNRALKDSGIFFCLKKLLLEFDVPKRLLGLKDGARRLTNIRHLAELLAKAEMELSGPDRLLSWLKNNVETPGTEREERRLRLETDENLVKVMTYHVSKGLEFPIVFIPFGHKLGTLPNPKGKNLELSCYYNQEVDEYISPICPPSPFDTEKTKSGCETLFAPNWEKELVRQLASEEIRLSYVAMTRAKYKLYLVFEKGKNIRESYLWGPIWKEFEMNATPFEMAMEHALAGRSGFTILKPKELCKGLNKSFEKSRSASRPLTVEKLKRPTQVHRKPLTRQKWSRISFSGITADIPFENVLLTFDKGLSPTEPAKAEPNIFHFPKGAVAGNCIHRFFELVEFHKIHEEAAVTALEEFGLEKIWKDVLVQMGHFVVETDLLANFLHGKSLRLKDLDPHYISKEMEFWWPFGPYLQENIPGVTTEKGVIKGYIDLFFQHKDKFYLLDYKSNWLGDTSDAYNKKAMIEAMDEHQYWLQAAIYAGAIDSFLRSSTPKYNRKKHFGGVFYLFVRGIDLKSQSIGNGILFTDWNGLAKRYPWLNEH